jgi:hypothetical protein
VTGPSNNLGTVSCSAADQAVCPPAGLLLGFNGSAGTPTITPTNTNTNITINTDTATVYTATGATNSTDPGYWFVVVGGTLRSWGQIGVAARSGSTAMPSVVNSPQSNFAAMIPLFCGQQAIVYRFDNGSGHSFWYAGVTRTNCSTATFRAQLTWDTGPTTGNPSNYSDIDLHLVRPGGTMFSQTNDCYYGDCNVLDVPNGLEWGASGSAGNPSLDVDNTVGYGPENITINSGPESGDYLVLIDNYNGVLSTHATVKLYFDDVEQASYTSLTLDYASNREFWYVAKVNIQNRTITPVDTYSANPPAVRGVVPTAVRTK